jgi:hypothetical protein
MPASGTTRPTSLDRLVRRAIALATLVAVLATSLGAASPVSAASPVVDPERNSTDVTGWTWTANQTVAQIGSTIANGYRIIDLELTSNAPTFSVSYVANSGGSARAGRVAGYRRRNSAVAVDNNAARSTSSPPNCQQPPLPRSWSRTPGSPEGYWWLYDQTPATRRLRPANTNRIDIDRFPGAASVLHDPHPNAGVDGSWWIWYGQTGPGRPT